MFLAIICRRLIRACILLSLAVPISALADSQIPTVRIKQDFEQLYAQLQQAHYDLYANVPKPIYDQHYRNFLAAINEPMSLAEVTVYFQRFVALGKVAHATIALPIEQFISYRAQGGTMLPMFVHIDDNKVTVTDYQGDNPAINNGQQLLAINGRSVESWIDEFSGLLSADNQRLSHTLIEARWPFLIWLIAGEQAQFEVSINSPTGPSIHTVSAMSRAQQAELNQDNEAPQQDADAPRAARVLDNYLGYLRPGPFYNLDSTSDDIWDNTAFTQFVDASFQQFNASHVQAVLIDLRGNPGGSNSFSDHMIAWFADRPFKFASQFNLKISPQAQQANQQRLSLNPESDEISLHYAELYQHHPMGSVIDVDMPEALPHKNKRFLKPVFVLIDRYSYSNAVSVAAIVQDYGFATVLGEATADLATTYGAMEHFTLPNTGIEVGFPKALIVRPNGDRQPAGVTPDITLNKLSDESDAKMLERVIDYIRRVTSPD